MDLVLVASVIQHAKCMRRITLASLANLAAPYFPTLSHEGRDCKKKSYWTQNVCFDFL
jgi:hypothetical protein